jgi:hypothetical protein
VTYQIIYHRNMQIMCVILCSSNGALDQLIITRTRINAIDSRVELAQGIIFGKSHQMCGPVSAFLHLQQRLELVTFGEEVRKRFFR